MLLVLGAVQINFVNIVYREKLYCLYIIISFSDKSDLHNIIIQLVKIIRRMPSLEFCLLSVNFRKWF